MILSPPFLPSDGLTSNDPDSIDPMMDAVDKFELAHHGVYPIAFDRRWHCGAHLQPKYQNDAVRALADGEVVAYRVCQKAIADGQKDVNGGDALNSNLGFVMLRHKTDTGDGRTITFYSLYMHLLDLDSIRKKIGPLPNNPPEVGSSTALPKWLAYPTDGVQSPKGLKVYRKDMLGYPGACHGQSHLHFETFMTESDFAAWFNQSGHAVQLGNKTPTTPASKDYWGHSYFVIPGGQAFVSAPPGAIGTTAPYFPPLQAGTLDAASKLYVAAYFHKGHRYTRAWVEKNGALTLLTPKPVRDTYAEYEYKMYARATALYPSCPSDGYELLRFGRILSEQPKLPPAAQKTWVSVPFEAGKQGYVDISLNTIQKLSDADFPFFMGWQEIEEGNTPFSQDGLCDQDELRKMVAVVEDLETPADRLREGFEQEDKLAAYIHTHAEVRAKLRGLICHAPSEWDASANEARHKPLKDPDGFFGRRKDIDPYGYDKFMAFHTQFQFMEQTPLGGGKKFWFFHPLAFLRHFRKCGWLNQTEIASTLPKHMFYTTSGAIRTAITTTGPTYTLTHNDAESRIAKFVIELNRCMRKYLGVDKKRVGIFLAQILLETAQWRNLGGSRRLLHEWGFGQYSSANPATQYYTVFYGRGIAQLTWAGNYRDYGTFAAIPNHIAAYTERLTPASPRITSSSLHYHIEPKR
ncbi:hypothetical protein Tamer19_63090 [Cupriavidus sp. TA19]|uniref:hypothetical protein n=1 Tax=unclassified Cupriavidus TaxID=2640874 RepID=UPI002729432C|nr:hypothetical protein [Cupriavidus sp. TA19]GLC96900.1 hypothetical protein Tamer19_63090 [Cupriavidus sp. TA19]